MSATPIWWVSSVRAHPECRHASAACSHFMDDLPPRPATPAEVAATYECVRCDPYFSGASTRPAPTAPVREVLSDQARQRLAERAAQRAERMAKAVTA